MLKSRWVIYSKITGEINGVIHGLTPPEDDVQGVVESDTADVGINSVNLLTGGFNDYPYIPVQTSNEQQSSVLLLRKQAYQDEADPLYMEWQYDQTPISEQTWRDKVAEIKVRIPLIV